MPRELIPVGTVRDRQGGKYRKVGEGQWVKVREGPPPNNVHPIRPPSPIADLQRRVEQHHDREQAAFQRKADREVHKAKEGVKAAQAALDHAKANPSAKPKVEMPSREKADAAHAKVEAARQKLDAIRARNNADPKVAAYRAKLEAAKATKTAKTKSIKEWAST